MNQHDAWGMMNGNELALCAYLHEHCDYELRSCSEFRHLSSQNHFHLQAPCQLPEVSNGRKDPGGYWQGGVKDGPIQGLVDVSKVTSVSTTKNHCHTPAQESKRSKGEKSFGKDFEPRPNISAYGDGDKVDEKKFL
ncbi:hypothetical protein Sango_0896000 [Sesamum angolense]|uniref:Uncharacterized protein n=1 Tax=Sesamum angolense TaxID=2727404 RepID=A0AAE2BXP2_9LAMI|nr:hypothetical protein Sango_0896000 [Sesamum angolense]